MFKIGLTTKTLTAICLTSLLTLSDVWTNPAIANPDDDHREGLPGRRIGGGTRGEKCLSDSEQLIALVPQSNLILTKKAYPDLLFYIPPTIARTKVDFSLLDENGNSVYQTSFNTTTQKDDNSGEIKPHSGKIINLRYLQSLNGKPLPILTPDKTYSWNLSINCGSSDTDSSSAISVFGSIQRVKSGSEPVGQLGHKPLLEQAIADRKSGFWEDALTKVAMLKYSKPHDSLITNIWTQLLEAEKLDSIMGKDSLIKFKITKDN